MTTERWSPIRDLSDPVDRLQITELRSLDALWQEQRAELEGTSAVVQFRERLATRWAIETGVIEKVYDVDRGTTELLIEQGLRRDIIERTDTGQDPALVLEMIRDHRTTIDGIFDFIARRRELTVGYVRALHAALTRHQSHVDGIDTQGRPIRIPLEHGVFKRLPNNPTRPDGSAHEYCPPEQVSAEMERLIAMHAAHERAGVPPEIESAFLHHRFAQIHPFQDGNGRVARALATLVLLRANWFPMVVDREQKADYIDTLEAADLGNLQYLVQLIADGQRRALVAALGLAEEAQAAADAGIEAIIGAARDKMIGGRVESEELTRARHTADRLGVVAAERMHELCATLRREVTAYVPQLSANVNSHPQGHSRARWHRATIGRAARRLNYGANIDTYGAWFQLRLKDNNTKVQDDIIVSLHGIGPTFRGLIGAVAFWERATREDDHWTVRDQGFLSEDVFQVNPHEPADEAEARFTDWLDRQLTLGLAIWQRGLASS